MNTALKEFDSMAALAKHLVSLEVKRLVVMHSAMDHAAQVVEKTAKDKIGTYQPEVGQFAAWAPLADATVADRIAQGYSPDEPLLRSGALRDSIKHEAGFTEAIIGSTSPIALYQELGTSKIPPRPFLGPAAIENAHKVEKIFGLALVGMFYGSEPIWSEL